MSITKDKANENIPGNPVILINDNGRHLFDDLINKQLAKAGFTKMSK